VRATGAGPPFIAPRFNHGCPTLLRFLKGGHSDASSLSSSQINLRVSASIYGPRRPIAFAPASQRVRRGTHSFAPFEDEWRHDAACRTKHLVSSPTSRSRERCPHTIPDDGAGLRPRRGAGPGLSLRENVSKYGRGQIQLGGPRIGHGDD
jgi:hypothetical protein